LTACEDRRPSHAVKVMTEFLRASLLRFVEQAGDHL